MPVRGLCRSRQYRERAEQCHQQREWFHYWESLSCALRF
jgi:hypothetical protein